MPAEALDETHQTTTNKMLENCPEINATNI